MSEPATRVTSKFRRDVERVSKDKVGGDVVRRFRAMFAPDLVATVRSKGPQRIGSGQYAVVKKPVAKKAKKK